MMQWLEFRSTDEYVKETKGARSLSVCYDPDSETVTFTNKCSACFERGEAIQMMKDIIKVLEGK